jgi:hypothetical protein
VQALEGRGREGQAFGGGGGGKAAGRWIRKGGGGQGHRALHLGEGGKHSRGGGAGLQGVAFGKRGYYITYLI